MIAVQIALAVNALALIAICVLLHQIRVAITRASTSVANKGGADTEDLRREMRKLFRRAG